MVQAPRTGIDDVREVIHEELGEYPETLWKIFYPEPIASASLAQVHRAVGWDGEQLAVKVSSGLFLCVVGPGVSANGVLYRGDRWSRKK